MSEYDTLPSWLWPFVFVVMLGWIVYQESKHSSELTKQRHEHAEAMRAARIELAAARRENQEVWAVLKPYLDGVSTDDEFWTAMEHLARRHPLASDTGVRICRMP